MAVSHSYPFSIHQGPSDDPNDVLAGTFFPKNFVRYSTSDQVSMLLLRHSVFRLRQDGIYDITGFRDLHLQW